MSNILLIDDDPDICDALSRFLRTRGYDVSIADSGASAVGLILSERFDLTICDVSMPGMDGIQTVRRLRESDPDLAVLMLTGVNDARLAVDSVAVGAMDYLIKPVSLTTLHAAVEQALHRRQLLVEQRRIERIIREEVAERTAELEADRRNLRGMTVTMVDALITVMETKDAHLRGHSQRVAAMAAAVAEHLRLPLGVVEQVRIAGRLHDVGTIGLREAVLNKPGSLTEDERRHVQKHVSIGVEILAPLKHLALAVTYVQDHHEQWDGRGYPRGLKGERISIGGRILAVCDTYDALTSSRSYQRLVDPLAALGVIDGLAGSSLDPACCAALAHVVMNLQPLPFVEVDAVPGLAVPRDEAVRRVPRRAFPGPIDEEHSDEVCALGLQPAGQSR